MGKKGKRQYVAPSKTVEYPYPSRYGSHESMVVNDNNGSRWVVCEDENGLYVTSRLRLDCGLADSWRGATKEWRKNTLDHYFPDGVIIDDNKPEA